MSGLLGSIIIDKIAEIKRKKRLKLSLIHLIEISEAYIKYTVNKEEDYSEETTKKLELVITEVYSK